jgi:hypothetical protein
MPFSLLPNIAAQLLIIRTIAILHICRMSLLHMDDMLYFRSISNKTFSTQIYIICSLFPLISIFSIQNNHLQCNTYQIFHFNNPPFYVNAMIYTVSFFDMRPCTYAVIFLIYEKSRKWFSTLFSLLI